MPTLLIIIVLIVVLLFGLSSMIQRSHATPGNSVLAGDATWTILRHA